MSKLSEYRARRSAELTARQAKYLDFMLRYQRKHGIAPTLREGADALGIKSVNGALVHVQALVTKGKVRAVERGSGHKYVAIDSGQPLS